MAFDSYYLDLTSIFWIIHNVDVIDNQTISIVTDFSKLELVFVILPQTNLQAEKSLDLLFSEMS